MRLGGGDVVCTCATLVSLFPPTRLGGKHYLLVGHGSPRPPWIKGGPKGGRACGHEAILGGHNNYDKHSYAGQTDFLLHICESYWYSLTVALFGPILIHGQQIVTIFLTSHHILTIFSRESPMRILTGSDSSLTSSHQECPLPSHIFTTTMMGMAPSASVGIFPPHPTFP